MASLRNLSYRLTRSSQNLSPRLWIRPIAQASAFAPRRWSLVTVANRVQSRGFNEDSASASPSRLSDAAANPTPSNRLYLGNLFFEVDEEAVKKLLEPFGKVLSTSVVRDSSGSSKGYAFGEFAEIDEAIKAKEELDQTVQEGRILVVNYARRNPTRRASQPSEPTSTLFVGNLDFGLSDKDLNGLFRPLANINDVRVAIDRRTGQPRGFAHADFADVKSAVAAFEKLDGMVFSGRVLRCDYSFTGRSQAMARFQANLKDKPFGGQENDSTDQKSPDERLVEESKPVQDFTSQTS